MSERESLIKRVEILKPGRVLDVGCGCGAFTAKLAPHCGRITAVDISESLIGRCASEKGTTNIDFRIMDARRLEFPADSFDLVLERASLHHMLDWKKALGEMIRVARADILIEEPIDDPRSEPKRNTMRAQRLFLALQAEVDYPHYEYVTIDDLRSSLTENGVPFEIETHFSDQPVTFDYYFEPWEQFTTRSRRPDYWRARLADFREELGDGELCENDIVFISAHK